MIILSRPAYAKVNLTLDVLAKRPDGYHNLESVFQEVSLHDDITLRLGTREPWKVKCNLPNIPCDERNLVWKAADAFCKECAFDPQGLTIEVYKRIPSEAGLGGGSADAAAVLMCLNERLEKPLSVQSLIDLGARIGSDVPFFILGGTAYAQGRGERLRKIEAKGKLHYVLVKPELSFSTPKLFAKLDSCTITHRPDQLGMEEALLSHDVDTVAGKLCNVFELAVVTDHPEISDIKELLLKQGALGAQMTGSGSVVFGVFSSEEDAETCGQALRSRYPNTFVCQSV